MNSESPHPAGDPLAAAEELALELRWYAEGALLAHVPLLLAFVEQHREEIVRLAAPSVEPGALLAATKQLVIQNGSVHLASELRAQIKELEIAAWLGGERNDTDRARLHREWTERHARAWRAWRIREYCHVADHCAPEIVARLLAGAGEPPLKQPRSCHPDPSA